jgi:hypothetical protein
VAFARRLDEIADMTVIPTSEAVSVASENLEKAAVNTDRSRNEYTKEQYDKSATELQQAVEKTAKGWHLLAGWLNPTEAALHGPGHEAYRLWVHHILPFYSHVQEISTATLEFAEALPGANFLLRKAKPMAAKASALVPDLQPEEVASVERDLSELDRLHRDRATMWKATMELDTKNRWVNDALSSLNQPEVVSGQTARMSRAVLGLISMTRLLAQSTPDKIDLTLSLARSMKGTLWLPILTAWHDQPARYAASTDSYWTPRAYVETAPFVRLIPTLIEQATTMVKETSRASKIAGKLA